MQAFINGTKYAVSTTVAPLSPITAISNAVEAEASATVIPTAGDVVIITSGWTDLDETVSRVKAASAGKFTLEGRNTVDTLQFPTGEGAGGYETAGDFVSLNQVTGVELSGGEQQFYNWQYVEDRNGRQRQKPTFKNAQSIVITMDDDPNKPWHAALIELDRKGTPCVLREILASGDTIYYYGYISYQKVPSKTLNENMKVSATFSLSAEPIRYRATP